MVYDSATTFWRVAIPIIAGWLAGCAGEDNHCPELVELLLGDAEFHVGQPGQIDVIASDADGDRLAFEWSLDPAPQSTGGGAPRLVQVDGQKAVFTWRPAITDVRGQRFADYALTLTVRDPDGCKASETIQVRVINDGVGGSAQLRFTDPAGAGQAVDGPCFDNGGRGVLVKVAGDLIDAEDVSIWLGEPVPPAANLVAGANGKEAHLFWCPPQEVLDQSLNHTITFMAGHSDTEEPIAKRYQVRFKRKAGAGCPGQPPVIRHDPPARFQGPLNYEIRAEITDDVGFKDRPYLAYVFAEPGGCNTHGVAPDTNGWNIVDFAATGEAGRWKASVPNRGLADGQEAELCYVISATDDDDPNGTACDHTTDSGLFTVALRGGGGGDQTYGYCDPCVSDAQCGGGGDLCVDLRGASFCAKSCGGAADCGQGQTCVEWQSVDGVTARQCLPDDLDCGQLCQADEIDAAGGNNERARAATLGAGSYERLSICGDDQDWFAIPVQQGQSITVRAHFDNGRGDLDLAMDMPGETDLAYQSLNGDVDVEQVTEPCVPTTGNAHVVVFPYQAAQNSYRLDVEVGPGDCDRICEDDAFEAGRGNDILDEFVVIDLPFDTAELPAPLRICREDDDYFGFEARAGQIISVFVGFVHRDGDLDVALYRSTGELVGASQGYRDVELIEVAAPVDDIYVVRVYGATRSVSNEYEMLVFLSERVACRSTLECAAGQYCSDDGCVDAACSRVDDCDGNHTCTPPRAGRAPGAGSACYAPCASDRDCRGDAGYSCKRFETFAPLACAPAGAGQAGARCAGHQDCAGAFSCFDLPGGYCAAGDCRDLGCPQGTVCGDGGRFIDVCLKACNNDGDCRAAEGYACRDVGGGRRACVVP